MAGVRPWKPAVLKIHRWIAMSVGLVLMLNAFTGLIMLAGRPLDKVLHRGLFEVPVQSSKVSLESIRIALRPEFGSQTLILRPGRIARDAMTIDVRGDNGWEGQLFIDPYTGKRLGARARFDVGLNGLFELHSQLLSGAIGKGLLVACAIGMIVMFVSGLVMWWPPRWTTAFKLALTGGRVRAAFDVHRVLGVIFGLWVILVSVGTGGILASRPATAWISRLASQTNLEAPKIVASTAPRVTLDAIVQQADASLPGGSIGSIQVSPKASQPIRVRKKVDGDPHPNGLSTAWLNPRTGELLRVDRWNAASWIFAVHSGGLGAVGLVVTAISGLALLGFGISGTWLWQVRRRARQALDRSGTPTRINLETHA